MGYSCWNRRDMSVTRLCPFLILLVGILLSTMSWFPRTEALPVTTTTTATTSTMDGHLESHSRHKREAMSSIVNMTTIRYPCGLPESETSGPRSCDGCSSAVVYLRRAQSALNALLSTVCRDSPSRFFLVCFGYLMCCCCSIFALLFRGWRSEVKRSRHLVTRFFSPGPGAL